MALDATVGSASANSYATRAEFRTYHAAHVDFEASEDLDDDAVDRALQQATRQFDAYVRWYSFATTQTQALAWPRTGLHDPGTLAVVASNSLPQRLKNACCEQARLLLARDRALESSQGQDGIRRLKAGSVELEFDATSGGGGGGVLQTIAPSAWQFVACWGELTQQGAGGAVPLSRSYR